MPPQTSAGYPVTPPSAPSRRWLRIILTIVVIIVLAILAYGAYLKWGADNGSSNRFSFNTGEYPTWYSIDGTKAAIVKGPSGFDKGSVRVLEAAPKVDGVTPVLAIVPQHNGMVFGTLDNHNTFTLLVGGGTVKRDLQVTPQGQAVFSYLPNGSSVWSLEYLDTIQATSTAKDVGPGLDARFINGNTTLLAVSPNGLDRVNPVNGGRLTILDRANLISGTFAISPDGTKAVLANPLSNQTDVFSITSDGIKIAYLGSMDSILYPIAFLPDGRLVAQTKTSGAIFNLSAAPFKPVSTFTFSK